MITSSSRVAPSSWLLVIRLGGLWKVIPFSTGCVDWNPAGEYSRRGNTPQPQPGRPKSTCMNISKTDYLSTAGGMNALKCMSI